MKPELDALIAEKVFGPSHFFMDAREFDPSTWKIPEGLLTKSYSTDIAAAWEVVEKLDLFGKREMFLDKDWNGHYRICQTVDAGMGTRDIDVSIAPTAPMAICLAALRAIGAL